MTLKNAHNFHAQSGLSLVELLVVIVIIVILATFALMQRGSANEQFQRQNVSRELKVAFERARFDSVKRRALDTSPDLRAYVQVRSDGFTLRTFKEQSGVWDLADDQVLNVPSGIVIEGNGLTLPATLIYNQRGEASVVGGGNASFFVCNNDCASAGFADKDAVLVTLTGTVNLLLGGATPAPLALPNYTSVPTDAGINPDAIVP